MTWLVRPLPDMRLQLPLKLDLAYLIHRLLDAGGRSFARRLSVSVILQVSNLMLAAEATHKWYLTHFPEYPRQRRTLVPFLH